MPAAHPERLLRHCLALLPREALARASDAELLSRFTRGRDGDAFAALVARHGPMVLGACRRLLRDAGSAEDVAQAAQAVAHWWGVTPQTVGVWRKALGVGALTEGMRRLERDHALEPGIAAAREKAVGESSDPERRRKIAEALRGRAKPAHVVEAMARGRTEAGKRRRAGE